MRGLSRVRGGGVGALGWACGQALGVPMIAAGWGVWPTARWQFWGEFPARWQSRAEFPAKWQFCAVFGPKSARDCHLGRRNARDCHLGTRNARDCHLGEFGAQNCHLATAQPRPEPHRSQPVNLRLSVDPLGFAPGHVELPGGRRRQMSLGTLPGFLRIGDGDIQACVR